MRLWNDYEGMTITDASPGTLPIEKLIRPEGRSAFFSTHDGSGAPAVLRLIESIHDDDEILDRWKTVSELKQTHLVAFKKFGQTVLDGTPIIYAVMETTDASLADILQERPLTLDETRQVATSLIAAVQALHASGLVHEHIEPANVLASHEIVKLRSDCIRDIPGHFTLAEAQALRTRDVHDIAVVLLRALTLHRNLAEFGTTRLPPPFDEVIRNGIAGTWDLQQIAAIVSPIPATTPVTVATPTTPTISVSPSATTQPPVAIPSKTPPPYKAAPAKPKLTLVDGSAAPRLAQADYSPAAVAAAIPAVIRPHVEPKSRITLPLDITLQHKRVWFASAAALIVFSFGWYGLHSSSARDPTHPLTTLADVSQPANLPATPMPSTPASVPPSAAASASATQWRVIAYTYNRQDQAQHKADQLAKQHKSLQPEVFTPNGHAPYLVTVGGLMSRDQAIAFKNRVRGEGLPRDLYAQNYR
jgi:eukaryotic-like serine/threonine-protein kinase